jgi:hypothetical protein
MTDLSQINLTPKNLKEGLETIGHLAKNVLEVGKLLKDSLVILETIFM